MVAYAVQAKLAGVNDSLFLCWDGLVALQKQFIQKAARGTIQ